MSRNYGYDLIKIVLFMVNNSKQIIFSRFNSANMYIDLLYSINISIPPIMSTNLIEILRILRIG